ncbi:hypothetical protein [Bradyrhizobium roseum]|uniref:hypothetical protein n=1 Tax=Bradyrhizobium roseum TaxID=3056648 RepID=UPI0026192502|nr:hypothetical protein [Bradyrhizobium roseus]WKA27898.1 hypothetical protein QUH67_30770 [Bradyrhizobium roseus]
MKFFTGSLAAGLVLLAGSAQAQGPGRYMAASDVEAPYVVGPRVVAPPSPYDAGPGYGYGPSLLPSTEVYSVLRDNGFSPLGIPRLRGFVYTIAALDRDGSGGRLVIDARNGRILRFMPRRWGSDNFDEEQSALPRPVPGPLGPPPRQALAPQVQAPQAQASQAHGPDHAAVRPSRPAQVASRAVPMPKASPLAAKPAPAAPAPIQQAAAPAPKSAEAQTAAPAAADAVAAKPAPSTAPTEEMPKAQGLE